MQSCGSIPQYQPQFLAQGNYESRDVYQSLDIAWSLLRLFPKELLRRIPEKTLAEFYNRDRSQ
jgi:V-type H+-transporting ATPase subunit B